jgi:sarcosine oxidase delta subunit
MIERKCDKWFLKNRDEGLWQILGQRSQAGTAASSQDECLGDFVHQQKNERFLDFARNDKKSGCKRVASSATRTKAGVTVFISRQTQVRPKKTV